MKRITAKEIFETFKANPERETIRIGKIRDAIKIVESLRVFGNLVDEDLMEEFFPGMGKHQWDKFVNSYNKDVIAWYNSLSVTSEENNRQLFLIYLLLGESDKMTLLRGQM